MGDSGRRKERNKIPLIGWEGTAGEKDARFGRRLRVSFRKLSRVKLKAGFLRGLGKGREWGKRAADSPASSYNGWQRAQVQCRAYGRLLPSRIDPQPFRVCVGTRA